MPLNDRANEELRHSMLTAARLIGARMNGGWTSGATLADAARDSAGNRADDDDAAGGLLDDLVNFGLLEEESNVHLASEAKRSLRHRRLRLTKKGWALWMGDVPPVPGVYDPRMEG